MPSKQGIKRPSGIRGECDQDPSLVLWEQEVPGSNPGAPTDVTGCQCCGYRMPLYENLGRGLYVTLYVGARIGHLRVGAPGAMVTVGPRGIRLPPANPPSAATNTPPARSKPSGPKATSGGGSGSVGPSRSLLRCHSRSGSTFEGREDSRYS